MAGRTSPLSPSPPPRQKLEVTFPTQLAAPSEIHSNALGGRWQIKQDRTQIGYKSNQTQIKYKSGPHQTEPGQIEPKAEPNGTQRETPSNSARMGHKSNRAQIGSRSDTSQVGLESAPVRPRSNRTQRVRFKPTRIRFRRGVVSARGAPDPSPLGTAPHIHPNENPKYLGARRH